jgi:prevent-host-death family protein
LYPVKNVDNKKVLPLQPEKSMNMNRPLWHQKIENEMKTLHSAEAKTHFSSVLKDVEAGNDVAIVYGKKKQAIAVIISYEKWKKGQKRELGTLEGKMSVTFAKEFAMTDEELITL